ncbi:MAG: twin-arginine translocation signal domain-containing protein, partial [Candidatus Thiodiazotropha sp.]
MQNINNRKITKNITWFGYCNSLRTDFIVGENSVMSKKENRRQFLKELGVLTATAVLPAALIT